MNSQSAACFARELGRALEKMRLFLGALSGRDRPAAGIEAVLLMLIKLAGDLDEIAALHRVARFVVGMSLQTRRVMRSAASARVSSQYGFCSRVSFGGDRLELDVDARFQRALRDGLANLP